MRSRGLCGSAHLQAIETEDCGREAIVRALRSPDCWAYKSENDEGMGPMRIRNASAAAASALAVLQLAACAQDMPNPETALIAGSIEKSPQLLPGVPNGFECPLVPNGFDPAGSIYRLDKSGTFYRVTAYGEEPAVATMKGYRQNIRVADYTFSDAQKSSAGVSFAVLQNALPGLTAAANADFKKSLKIDVTVSDMMAESIDDQVADHILARFKSEVKPKPGSKYFLVRETIRAGAVSYSLHREDLAKLGSEAQLEKLASGKADVTFKENAGLISITQKFLPDRVPVCIKAAEIVIEPVRGEQPVLTLKDARDTELPAINKIGADEAKKG